MRKTNEWLRSLEENYILYEVKAILTYFNYKKLEFDFSFIQIIINGREFEKEKELVKYINIKG